MAIFLAQHQFSLFMASFLIYILLLLNSVSVDVPISDYMIVISVHAYYITYHLYLSHFCVFGHSLRLHLLTTGTFLHHIIYFFCHITLFPLYKDGKFDNISDIYFYFVVKETVYT